MTIPSTLGDAASAVTGGLFGTLQDVKIGDIFVSALVSLSNPKTKTMTKKPVQAGYDVTRATVQEPQVLIMGVCFADPSFSPTALLDVALSGDAENMLATWREKRDTLDQYWDDDEIIEVQTHEGSYPSMIVTNIDPQWDVDDNIDGFDAIVTLEEYVEVSEAGNAGWLDQDTDDS